MSHFGFHLKNAIANSNAATLALLAMLLAAHYSDVLMMKHSLQCAASNTSEVLAQDLTIMPSGW